MSDKQNWLTAGDAAKVLRVSQRQVHYYGEHGKLVTRRAGRRVLFSAESVASLADELSVDYKPTPPPSRELAPLIDTLDQLRQRDQEFTEGQRRIEDRLTRIEQRTDPPRWLVVTIAVIAIVSIITLAVVLVIALRFS